ncbi:hypothetical protein RQP46_004220 [Phenoliferia psychrophenolica]
MTSVFAYAELCACILCRKPMGPGTGAQRLQCSRCEVYYCSANCQKLHWKDHKALCRLHAEQTYKTEAAALSQRVRGRVKEDLRRLIKDSMRSLSIFFPALFNLGSKDGDKTRSHLLHLQLDYSPEGESLSQRLTLRRVAFWRRTDLVAAQSDTKRKTSLSDLLSVYGSHEEGLNVPPGFSTPAVLWDVLFDSRRVPDVGLDTHYIMNPYQIQYISNCEPGVALDDDALLAAIKTAFAKLDLD